MSSFFSSLAKTVVRAAVYESVRSGMRSSSSRGATPHFLVEVGPAIPQPPGKSCLDPSLPSYARHQVKPFTAGRIALLVMASLLAAFFGPIAVFVYGATLYFKRRVKYSWTNSAQIRIPDCTVAGGSRLAGYTTAPHIQEGIADGPTRHILRTNGKIAMIIGAVCLLVQIVITYAGK